MSIADGSSGHAVLEEDVVTHRVPLISTGSPIMVLIGSIGQQDAVRRARRVRTSDWTATAQISATKAVERRGRQRDRAAGGIQQERAGVARAARTNSGGSSDVLVSLKAHLG
jgi:hypothetical protein